MTEPRLTEQAEADLLELWTYIAVNNPEELTGHWKLNGVHHRRSRQMKYHAFRGRKSRDEPVEIGAR